MWDYVPAGLAFGVAPGIDAVIRVPELPDSEFSGKVTRIADALQSGIRTLTTEIDITNSDSALGLVSTARSSSIFRARRRASWCRPMRSSSTATECRSPSSTTARWSSAR